MVRGSALKTIPGTERTSGWKNFLHPVTVKEYNELPGITAEVISHSLHGLSEVVSDGITG